MFPKVFGPRILSFVANFFLNQYFLTWDIEHTLGNNNYMPDGLDLKQVEKI